MLRKTVATLALVAAAALAIPATAQDANAPPPGMEVATFASGCFWCTESDFDKVAGVTATVSGYIGGMTVKPTYEQVSAGRTGHAEAVQVTFDPKKVTYQQLLDQYWHNVDPLDNGGQFCDRGSHYRPAIFVHTPEQRKLAEESKAALDASKQFSRPIVVEITNASAFTPAEDYHQDYYKKEPLRYKIYRHGCGRDARLEALWGKPKS